VRVDVSFKYLERSDYIETILANDLRKIERRVKIFKKEDPIHISVHIEKNPKKEQYFCRSHIYLPTSKVLIADEKGKKAGEAINRAFSALTKQLDKAKYKLERRPSRRRARVKQDSVVKWQRQ